MCRPIRLIGWILIGMLSALPAQGQPSPAAVRSPDADASRQDRAKNLTAEQKRFLDSLETLPSCRAVSPDGQSTSPPVDFTLVSRKVTDALLRQINAFPNVEKLSIVNTSVTDAGLEALKDLKGLRELRLHSGLVSDAGLKQLRGLSKLQVLTLRCPEVTDAGLKDVGAIAGLQELTLGCLGITDAGLRELHGLKKLRRLQVFHAKLTAAETKSLLQALPALEKDAVEFHKLPVLLGAKLLKPEPGDDELRKLLKERYNAAANELHDRFDEFLAGRGTFDAMIASCRRLVRAALQVHEQPADRIAFLEQFVALTRQAELIEQARFDAGRIPEHQVFRARYARLDAEIELLRARRRSK